mmetsp:Transcript_5490/g.21653  ORF Transcript_5490/g.21653 Transcript_5490/m.21653 type:complete len:407 (+) Transcript_5490:72-1292(+)
MRDVRSPAPRTLRGVCERRLGGHLGLEEVLDDGHLLLGAREERHALVHLLGHDLQHAALAVRARATSLLSDEGHGRALVQQPQLAVGVLGVARVAVHAAVEHGAVEVAHERADVARRVGLGARALRRLGEVDVVLHALGPVGGVALVERVDLALLGDLDVVVAEDELANGGVEGEAVHAVPDGEHEDHRRRVHAVAGAHQVLARLAHVDDAVLRHLVDLGGAVLAPGGHARLGGLVDAPDRAGGDSGVDVGRAVKRVEHADVLAVLGGLDGHRHVLLLRGDDARAARLLEAVAEHLVGDHVELLLVLALHVLLALEAGEVGDASALHEVGNLLAGGADGRQHGGELVVDAALALLGQQPRVEGRHLVGRRRRLHRARAASGRARGAHGRARGDARLRREHRSLHAW